MGRGPRLQWWPFGLFRLYTFRGRGCTDACPAVMGLGTRAGPRIGVLHACRVLSWHAAAEVGAVARTIS